MDNKAAPTAYRVLAPIRLDPAWQFYAGGVLPSQPVGVGFNYVVTLIGSNEHYWTAKGSLEIGDGNAKEIYIRKGPTHRRAFTSKIGN